MARKKVKLAWIPNDAARRTTFRKRSKGIIKKASELSTLCDVQGAAIVYGPNEAMPEVWPSVEGAAAVLDRFYSMPETERTKKMMNQEKFLGDRIVKTSTQVEKAQKENDEAECAALMFRCIANMGLMQELDMTATMNLAWMVEKKMRVVKDRIKALTVQQQQQPFIAAPEYGDGMAGQFFYPPAPSPLFGDGSDGYLQLPGVVAGGASSSIHHAADMSHHLDDDDDVNFKNLL